MKAIWNDQIIAESSQTRLVEGNHYFPADSIKAEFFRPSDHQTVCHWKGTASYYHVQVNGQANLNAAWFYPEPKDAAAHIKNYVGFWKGVKVVE
jgi:uncharacterized protein (DUF427 family)